MTTASASNRLAFEFGTKAETLDRLRGSLRHARLCEQIHFTSRDWQSDPATVLDGIFANMTGAAFAIRSSRLDEDGHDQSMAGAYASVIGVPLERDAISAAVSAVLASYGGDILPEDQVLVQPMVTDVTASGVAFSYDIATGAPYVTINYDDFSGRTDTVTAGGQSKLIVVRRGGEDSMRSTRFRNLIDVIYELEEITASKAVDIEFCIDASDRIYVLQVRPLAVQHSMSAGDLQSFHDRLNSLEHEVSRCLAVSQSLPGRRTILGEMPDWNPAEMIGTTPTPLAASLYSSLITDRVWSRARAEMGYRDVAVPLMVMLEGHPYIDVQRSLNSFLPAGVPDRLAAKIVDAQIDFLEDNQHCHDKIEFDVAITAWDFALAPRLAILRDAGLSAADIDAFERHALSHTRTMLSDRQTSPDAALAHVRGLRSRIDAARSLPPLDRGLEILRETAPHGTVPFAILARQAFVAMALLRSLVSTGAMSQDDYAAFLRSIHTVATDFVHHRARLSAGAVQESDFMGRYGHLRPGTYDIRVPRYDEAPELYLSGDAPEPAEPPPFEPTPALCRDIDGLLTEADIPLDTGALLGFARTAIAGRELAKFQFTRGISNALQAFCEWGAAAGVERDEIAFLRLESLSAIGAGETSPDALRESVEAARIRQQQDRRIRLPSIVASRADCNVVRMPLGKPNFITAGKVAGPVAVLSTDQQRFDIDGTIVVIESADPGFDWIFSHAILGLVTKYGGANSHMAIRCAEFELPAAIGCGERNFAMILEAGRVEIDCVGETIRV